MHWPGHSTLHVYFPVSELSSKASSHVRYAFLGRFRVVFPFFWPRRLAPDFRSKDSILASRQEYLGEAHLSHPAAQSLAQPPPQWNSPRTPPPMEHDLDPLTFCKRAWLNPGGGCRRKRHRRRPPPIGHRSEKTPGPRPSLNRGEVVTLALFGQWNCFPSERGFYRYASRRLRSAFPTLPYRGQFNRLMRRHYDSYCCFLSISMVVRLQSQDCPYEALDGTGVPTRDAKRRGAGWLAGQADIGWSNRLGWYEGFYLLVSVNPQG